MKFSIISFVFLAAFAFTSCQKGDFSKDKWDKEGKGEWDKGEEDKETCFELVYPVTYNMPDGSSVSGGEAEVESGIKAWYEANPDSEAKPELQYPVNVIFKGEVEKTIQNEEEMELVKKACDEDKGCFKLVYPIAYLMPDGTTISGGEEEVWEAVKAWYDANPNSETKPELQYPVEIIFEDEEVKSINNEEEMLWVKKTCADKAYGDKICFEILYPVSWLMPDGSEITAVNEEEFWAGVKSWYDVNPDSEDKPELQYPVEVKYDDGTIETLGSEEAMIAAKKDCFEAAEDPD